MKDEIFPLVNEDGNVIGQASRKECHNGSKLLHPVIHLHIFNTEGKLFLQKRSAKKDIQPDKWDSSVGGHIDLGESPEQAAHREAHEEIGLVSLSIHYIDKYIIETDIERELTYCFFAITDNQITIDKDEVSDGYFWTLNEIQSKLNQGIFTPNFELDFNLFSIKGKNNLKKRLKNANIMTQFKLIKDGGSAHEHDISTLKEAVYNLKDEEDSFIILEPKQPVEDSIYLQAVNQEGVYIAEIRFVFGSDDNYKHYSCIFEQKEDLFEVFSQYYLDYKIPDIKSWKNETNSFNEEADDEMLKLYKNIKGITHYFEVWLNDDDESLTIHSGVLGEVGETEGIIYDDDDDLPVKVAMAKLIASQKDLGYSDTVVLTELIIQYSYNESSDMNALLKKRQEIESLLNECLGWTGNGHCDGGDIGSGTMNIFCYVVNKEIALKTILQMLVEEGYLDGVRIAYADETTEEYELLYPKGGTFAIIPKR